MQTGSFRGLGEPAWVNAYSNACEGLGPYPRTALGPAAIRAASTGRTVTAPDHAVSSQKVLARAPSTRDPLRSIASQLCCYAQHGPAERYARVRFYFNFRLASAACVH